MHRNNEFTLQEVPENNNEESPRKRLKIEMVRSLLSDSESEDSTSSTTILEDLNKKWSCEMTSMTFAKSHTSLTKQKPSTLRLYTSYQDLRTNYGDQLRQAAGTCQNGSAQKTGLTYGYKSSRPCRARGVSYENYRAYMLQEEENRDNDIRINAAIPHSYKSTSSKPSETKKGNFSVMKKKSGLRKNTFLVQNASEERKNILANRNMAQPMSRPNKSTKFVETKSKQNAHNDFTGLMTPQRRNSSYKQNTSSSRFRINDYQNTTYNNTLSPVLNRKLYQSFSPPKDHTWHPLLYKADFETTADFSGMTFVEPTDAIVIAGASDEPMQNLAIEDCDEELPFSEEDIDRILEGYRQDGFFTRDQSADLCTGEEEEDEEAFDDQPFSVSLITSSALSSTRVFNPQNRRGRNMNDAPAGNNKQAHHRSSITRKPQSTPGTCECYKQECQCGKHPCEKRPQIDYDETSEQDNCEQQCDSGENTSKRVSHADCTGMSIDDSFEQFKQHQSLLNSSRRSVQIECDLQSLDDSFEEFKQHQSLANSSRKSVQIGCGQKSTSEKCGNKQQSNCGESSSKKSPQVGCDEESLDDSFEQFKQHQSLANSSRKSVQIGCGQKSTSEKCGNKQQSNCGESSSKKSPQVGCDEESLDDSFEQFKQHQNLANSSRKSVQIGCGQKSTSEKCGNKQQSNCGESSSKKSPQVGCDEESLDDSFEQFKQHQSLANSSRKSVQIGCGQKSTSEKCGNKQQSKCGESSSKKSPQIGCDEESLDDSFEQFKQHQSLANSSRKSVQIGCGQKSIPEKCGNKQQSNCGESSSKKSPQVGCDEESLDDSFEQFKQHQNLSNSSRKSVQIGCGQKSASEKCGNKQQSNCGESSSKKSPQIGCDEVSLDDSFEQFKQHQSLANSSRKSVQIGCDQKSASDKCGNKQQSNCGESSPRKSVQIGCGGKSTPEKSASNPTQQSKCGESSSKKSSQTNCGGKATPEKCDDKKQQSKCGENPSKKNSPSGCGEKGSPPPEERNQAGKNSSKKALEFDCKQKCPQEMDLACKKLTLKERQHIVKMQLQKLIKDENCPGAIVETLQGKLDFNNLSFKVTLGENYKVNPNLPEVEPISLIEAFLKRIQVEKDNIESYKRSANFRDTFNFKVRGIFSYYDSQFNTELNAAIKTFILADLIYKNCHPPIHAQPFYSLIRKGEVTLDEDSKITRTYNISTTTYNPIRDENMYEDVIVGDQPCRSKSRARDMLKAIASFKRKRSLPQCNHDDD
ncbi:uncharacterized protein LOC119672566 isoform X3 [Teleopsis dalmanni]|uniref:uncharacterized protein LOC119672566 isoform X3 n=1 Tax=Teleopsis dalmanni TaxID=139649 RepID=UPI0018CF42FC|nr:uncharacterized protein LOC119672566 isoform X3 [Teleopsis dalmanni]